MQNRDNQASNRAQADQSNENRGGSIQLEGIQIQMNDDSQQRPLNDIDQINLRLSGLQIETLNMQN